MSLRINSERLDLNIVAVLMTPKKKERKEILYFNVSNRYLLMES